MIRAVARNINNLAELERLKKQERQVQVSVAELSNIPADFGVSIKVD